MSAKVSNVRVASLSTISSGPEVPVLYRIDDHSDTRSTTIAADIRSRDGVAFIST
jgi:hypothetical protein